MLLIAAFLFVELRVAEAPLIPLSIFKLRQLRTANLIVVLMYAALFSMFFFITLYLQQVLGDDPIQAGLSFLPMTLSVFTGSTLAPRLVARFGVRGTVSAGMLAASAGLLLFTGIHPGANYFAAVLPGGVLSGIGMGLGLVGSTIAATQGVQRAQAGLASGLLNTSRLFGGALGLAVLSTIAASRTQAALGVSHAAALTDGFVAAFEVGAALCLTGAAIALVLLRAPANVEREPEVVDERIEEPEAVAA